MQKWNLNINRVSDGFDLQSSHATCSTIIETIISLTVIDSENILKCEMSVGWK